MECDMYAYFFLLSYERSMHNIPSYYKKYYAYYSHGSFRISLPYACIYIIYSPTRVCLLLVRLLIFSRNSCALAQAPECGRVVDAALLHSAQSTTHSHNADHYSPGVVLYLVLHHVVLVHCITSYES
mgnify:CR=1 FL=1